MREPLAQPPDLAGILDQGETGAHRRHAPDRDIGRRGHRETGGGKAKYQPVGILAHREVLAFAHHVPDVTEHEQIAGDRARQARDIVGISGHKAGGEAFCKVRGRILLGDSIAHPQR